MYLFPLWKRGVGGIFLVLFVCKSAQYWKISDEKLQYFFDLSPTFVIVPVFSNINSCTYSRQSLAVRCLYLFLWRWKRAYIIAALRLSNKYKSMPPMLQAIYNYIVCHYIGSHPKFGDYKVIWNLKNFKMIFFNLLVFNLLFKFMKHYLNRINLIYLKRP